MGLQNWMFSSIGSELSFKIRSRSFKQLLRQDVSYYDDEVNNVSYAFATPQHVFTRVSQTGAVTARLSTDAEKVNGLVGITFGA